MLSGDIVCKKCGRSTDREIIKKKKYICPACGGYFRIPARERIVMIADKDTFEAWDDSVESIASVADKEYQDKLAEARE